MKGKKTYFCLAVMLLTFALAVSAASAAGTAETGNLTGKLTELNVGTMTVDYDNSNLTVGVDLIWPLCIGYVEVSGDVEGEQDFPGLFHNWVSSYEFGLGSIGNKKGVQVDVDGNLKLLGCLGAGFYGSMYYLNPFYRAPAEDYYFYGEGGFLPGEMVIEPEETAVAPCPFWALMERAEELAGALDEESGWGAIWGAKLAYWDAFHQYLICRDEHFTAEEEAEAAKRLEAVKEIIDAY